MQVIEKPSGTKIEVEVQRVKNSELKGIKKSKNFTFDWEQQTEGDLHKLVIKGSNEIIALINVVVNDDPAFKCVEVLAIEKRKSQEGKPDYQNVAGCLFAFAARQSFLNGLDGYLFLIAKTEKAKLFHGKYGFTYISDTDAQGIKMYSDTNNSYKLIKNFS